MEGTNHDILEVNMKLAEALILRADLQKRMEQVRMRLYNNVLTQEGEKPSEDPNGLLNEFMAMQNELTMLIKSINKTNCHTPFDDQMMVSDALVERDALLAKRGVLTAAAERASEKPDRYSKTEIKNISTINVKKFQTEADQLAKEFRELDTKIQGMNWTIDLI